MPVALNPTQKASEPLVVKGLPVKAWGRRYDELLLRLELQEVERLGRESWSRGERRLAARLERGRK